MGDTPRGGDGNMEKYLFSEETLGYSTSPDPSNVDKRLLVTGSKNVLIDNGKFSGLVDIDTIVYGDPLEAVGSIKASWFGTHYCEVYTKAIEDEIRLVYEEPPQFIVG